MESGLRALVSEPAQEAARCRTLAACPSCCARRATPARVGERRAAVAQGRPISVAGGGRPGLGRRRTAGARAFAS